MPSGGVDDGDTYEDALLREVREELGVKATRYEPVYSATYEKPSVAFLMEYYVVTEWATQSLPGGVDPGRCFSHR